LNPEEAHHLRHVLRLGPGAKILLLDTQGKEYLARVERTARREVWVKVEKLWRQEPPFTKEIILALPLLKRDLLGFLVEKAVELGIHTVVLMETQRSVAKERRNLRQKLERRALQALKQCRRLWSLHLEGPWPLAKVARMEAHKKLVAYEREENPLSPASFNIENHQRLLLVSGPEGGFAPEEIALFYTQGFESISLGSYILRAETAAFYLMCLAHSQNFLGSGN